MSYPYERYEYDDDPDRVPSYRIVLLFDPVLRTLFIKLPGDKDIPNLAVKVLREELHLVGEQREVLSFFRTRVPSQRLKKHLQTHLERQKLSADRQKRFNVDAFLRAVSKQKPGEVAGKELSYWLNTVTDPQPETAGYIKAWLQMCDTLELYLYRQFFDIVAHLKDLAWELIERWRAGR